ncbi:hypothetical protein XH83_01925 [Bradyrhizobium sp. CCBAU 53351]|nr:hypothetical protein XH83_01925 [Bradyrhizobium sp. CCBAU 53351]
MRDVLAEEVQPLQFGKQAAPDLRSELPEVLNQVFSGLVLFCTHHRALRRATLSSRPEAIACDRSDKVRS